MFEDVSSVERGGINISLKADTVRKKVNAAAKPEHTQPEKQADSPQPHDKGNQKPGKKPNN